MSCMYLDGILTLVQMMQKDNPRLREFSTLAMSNLTQSNPNNIRYVITDEDIRHRLIVYIENCKHQGGLEVLIHLLNDEKDTTKAYACAALANCSTDQVVRTNILEKGLITNLLAPLHSRYYFDNNSKASIVTRYIF